MKIKGLKEAVRMFTSGELRDPVILFYPEELCIEACRSIDCTGDAFDSMAFFPTD